MDKEHSMSLTFKTGVRVGQIVYWVANGGRYSGRVKHIHYAGVNAGKGIVANLIMDNVRKCS